VRSRRPLVFLIIAVVIAVGAAAPFAPRVFWAARVAWTARGLESPVEDERWKARLALLELPEERVAPLKPRIIAGAAADDARHGGLLFVQRGDVYEPVFPANATAPLGRVGGAFYFGEVPVPVLVRDRLSPKVDSRAPRLITFRDNGGDIVVPVLQAPLDPEGETLRLLREQLPR
jgi:hypothetical protein